MANLKSSPFPPKMSFKREMKSFLESQQKHQENSAMFSSSSAISSENSVSLSPFLPNLKVSQSFDSSGSNYNTNVSSLALSSASSRAFSLSPSRISPETVLTVSESFAGFSGESQIKNRQAITTESPDSGVDSSSVVDNDDHDLDHGREIDHEVKSSEEIDIHTLSRDSNEVLGSSVEATKLSKYFGSQMDPEAHRDSSMLSLKRKLDECESQSQFSAQESFELRRRSLDPSWYIRSRKGSAALSTCSNGTNEGENFPNNKDPELDSNSGPEDGNEGEQSDFDMGMDCASLEIIEDDESIAGTHTTEKGSGIPNKRSSASDTPSDKEYDEDSDIDEHVNTVRQHSLDVTENPKQHREESETKRGDANGSNFLSKLPIPIKCEECGHTFHSNASFAIHQRKHTGERPFVCDECGLGFTQKGNLSRHKQTHLDSKPFKCDQCSYATKRKDALLTHKSTHFLNKRYKCTYCSQAYKQRQSLRDHLRACHRIPSEELRDILSDSVAQVQLRSLGSSPSPSTPSPRPPQSGGLLYPPRGPSQMGFVGPQKDLGVPMSTDSAPGNYGLAGLGGAVVGRAELEERLRIRHQQIIDIKQKYATLPPIDGALSRRVSSYQPVSPPASSVNDHRQHHLPRQHHLLPGNLCDLTLGMDRNLQRSVRDRSLPPVGFLRQNQGLIHTTDTRVLSSQSYLGPHSLLPGGSGGNLASVLARNLPHREERQLPLGHPGNLYSQSRHPVSVDATGLHASVAVTTAQHINALAAAYNLPGYPSMAKPPAGLHANHSNSAVAIAYAHHQQLEAARRINQRFQHQLPPLIRPPQHRNDSILAEETKNDGTNTKNVLTVNVSPVDISEENRSSEIPISDSSMDQENCRVRELNPQPSNMTRDTNKKDACLSCQKDSLKCETCCIVFSDSVMYTIHLGLHSKLDPLKCNMCGFVAENRYDFASHIARGDHKTTSSSPSSPKKTL